MKYIQGRTAITYVDYHGKNRQTVREETFSTFRWSSTCSPNSIQSILEPD